MTEFLILLLTALGALLLFRWAVECCFSFIEWLLGFRK